MFTEGPPIPHKLTELKPKNQKEKEKRPNRGGRKSERRKGRGGNPHNHPPPKTRKGLSLVYCT